MTDRIRITFCLGNGGIGGTELNAVRTAERLDRDRYDLDVVQLADHPPLRERYEAVGVPVRTMRLRSLKSADFVRQGRALVRHLRERGTQILHAQDSYGNLFAVPWARMARVRGVIASRRWWAEPPAGHDRWNALAFRLAHRVITNTGSVARRMIEEEGIPREKIRITPNFLDEASFAPTSPEAIRDFRAELGVPADAPLIGIVAQLRPEKDHGTLVRAAAALGDGHPDAHVVLIGDGAGRSSIEGLVRELGLEGRVHLAGERRGPGNLHGLFDISVLCSRAEALSNSILEAMAAGRPVVATRVGGNPDAVIDGRTGLLVPPEDPEGLATALARLLDDPALARELGDEGARRARREYTVDAALTALARAYGELLPSGRGSRVLAGAAA